VPAACGDQWTTHHLEKEDNMSKRWGNLVAIGFGAMVMLGLGAQSTWADPESKEYSEKGYEREGDGGHRMGMRMGMMGGMHGGAGHLIRHMLKHEKDLGLKEDQVVKLKEMQLNLDKTRIKTEADIQVAERELRALIEDDKSDFGAIEAKLKQSEELQVGLRMTSIKTRREVLALLTPEQREKEKAEHEKMMQQHKMPMRGHDGSRGEMKGHGKKDGDKKGQ
jgi:periplasmic protein CpxP/Spy